MSEDNKRICIGCIIKGGVEDEKIIGHDWNREDDSRCSFCSQKKWTVEMQPYFYQGFLNQHAIYANDNQEEEITIHA